MLSTTSHRCSRFHSVRELSGHVLEGVPGAVHRAEVQVANALEVVDLVLVEAAFPEPAAEIVQRRACPLAVEAPAAGKRPVGQVQRPRAARERGRDAAGPYRQPQRLLVLALAQQYLRRVRDIREVPQVARTHDPFPGEIEGVAILRFLRQAQGGAAELRHRVAHGHTQAVRQQIGRAHLVHRLLVHVPTARVSELLGLQQDVLCRGRRREQSEAGEQ